MSATRLLGRRAAFCSAIVAALFLAVPAHADESAGVEAGRSAARAILIFRDPWPCATLLLSARCDADVAHMIGADGDAVASSIPHAGKHPVSGLHDFIEHGNRDGYDPALVYINTIAAPASMWKSDATAATRFDIGAAQVLIPASVDIFAMRVLGSGDVLDLEAHKESGELAGADEALVASLGLENKAAVIDTHATSESILAASFARFPEPPLFAAAYDGPGGNALFGLASSWVAELIDNPPWLAQADVRAFVVAWANRAVTVNAGAESARDDFLRQLKVRPFDHDRVLRDEKLLSAAVLRDEPVKLTKQVFVGIIAGQVGYNAAVLHDRTFAQVGLGLLRDVDDFDAVAPNFARLRKAAASLSLTDWSAQFALSRELTSAIVEANGPR